MRRKTFLLASLVALLFCAQAFGADWATFLGGTMDERAADIGLDAANNVYVVGTTRSADFPATTGAYDVDRGRDGWSNTGYFEDVFAAKICPTGDTLLYATYLGGPYRDEGQGIYVDASGNAYITGMNGGGFPVTTTGIDTTTGQGAGDVFVGKINPAGDTLYFCALAGGTALDAGYDITVDGSGNVYVAGYTESDDFPTTSTAVAETLNGTRDAFVLWVVPTADTLTYSTYLGGSSMEVALALDHHDTTDALVVIGNTYSSDFPYTAASLDTTYSALGDMFVVKFDVVKDSVLYATYLGGTQWDTGEDITSDKLGYAYLTGATYSTDFPHAAGAYDTAGAWQASAAYDTTHGGGGADAIFAKLCPTGDTLYCASFYGGSGWDHGKGIAVDSSYYVYIAGLTTSSDLPFTTGATDSTYSAEWDVFVARFNPAGDTLYYGAFLGGTSYEAAYGIAVDVTASVHIAGMTRSTDFPYTSGAYDTTYGGGTSDVFVARLDVSGP